MAVPGTPQEITVISVARSSWLRRRLAAPPGDWPAPAPSPAQPWQYWQSAFSRNTRRPCAKSCAEALDDAAMIARRAYTMQRMVEFIALNSILRAPPRPRGG